MTSLLLCPWGDSFNLAPIVYLIQGRLNRNKAREHLHINNDHVGAAALPCVTETTEAPVSLDHAWGSKPQLSAPGLIQCGEADVNHMRLLTGSDGRHWGGPWYEGPSMCYHHQLLSQGHLGYCVLQADIINTLISSWFLTL